MKKSLFRLLILVCAFSICWQEMDIVLKIVILAVFILLILNWAIEMLTKTLADYFAQCKELKALKDELKAEIIQEQTEN